MAKEVRVFLPENRLRNITGSGLGLADEELVEVAESRIRQIRPSIRTELEKYIDEISAFSVSSDETLFDQREKIFSLALMIAEVGGAVGFQVIGEISRGLSATIESLAEDGWRAEVVRLHLQAVLLARQSSAELHEGSAVLSSLKQMCQKLNVVE